VLTGITWAGSPWVQGTPSQSMPCWRILYQVLTRMVVEMNWDIELQIHRFCLYLWTSSRKQVEILQSLWATHEASTYRYFPLISPSFCFFVTMLFVKYAKSITCQHPPTISFCLIFLYLCLYCEDIFKKKILFKYHKCILKKKKKSIIGLTVQNLNKKTIMIT
jgi:hypothetical protein